MVPNRSTHHISRGIPLRFTFTAQKMKFSIKVFSSKYGVTLFSTIILETKVPIFRKSITWSNIQICTKHASKINVQTTYAHDKLWKEHSIQTDWRRIKTFLKTLQPFYFWDINVCRFSKFSIYKFRQNMQLKQWVDTKHES